MGGVVWFVVFYMLFSVFVGWGGVVLVFKIGVIGNIGVDVM